MGLAHTATCDKRRVSRERARERWRKKWSNHCPSCCGNTDSGDPCTGTQRGDPRELMPLRDGERGCLFQLWCPRCGIPNAMHPEDATIPCKYCGWTEVEDHAAPDNSIPHEFECSCRVALAAQMEAHRSRIQGEIGRLYQELDKVRA